MKTIKQKIRHNRLIQLNFVKTKIYKKAYLTKNLKLEDINNRFKNSILIIWKYEISERKILFIFNSFTQQEFYTKPFFKKNQHTFIFRNHFNSTEFFFWTVFKLILEFDLVVIIGDLSNNPNFWSVNKPLIYIGNYEANLFDYLVAGNFSNKTKKIKDNFFYELLLLILRKWKV